MISFIVYGKPQAKERPRVVRNQNGKVHTYTPNKTAEYEIAVQAAFIDALPIEEQTRIILDGEYYYPAGTPLTVRIMAYFKVPKNKIDKGGGIIGYPTKRPDLDNVAKSICDSLNGTAYKDDSQVVDLGISKSWTKSDERVVVHISPTDENYYLTEKLYLKSKKSPENG